MRTSNISAVQRQTFRRAKQKNNSYQSRGEKKRTQHQESKKAEQSFWDRHVGKSNDFGPPKESLVDKVNESGAKEIAIGGAAGALLGAGVGYAYGMGQLSKNEVSIQDVSETVTTPKLVGADYDHSYYRTEMYTTTDSDGNSQTHYRQVYVPDDWDPIVEHLDTGERRNYKKLVNSSSFGPLGGAAMGAGIGLVTGVALGALTRALTKGGEPTETPSYDRWGRYDRTEPKSARERAADLAPRVGTAVGAAAGGLAGYVAGSATESAGTTLTQTIIEPVFEREVIGHIPRTSEYRNIPKNLLHSGDKVYYKELPHTYGSDPFHGSERIVRSVFQGKFEPVETTEKSNFFNPTRGAIAGTLLGAGVGFGVGVATGILMRMTEQDEA